MGHERDLIIKKLLHQTLNEQVEKLKDSDEADHSFIYLEGESIHLLLMYILLGLDQQGKINHNGIEEYKTELESLCDQAEEVSKELDQLIKQFS
ncbi:hypothetical protein ACTWQB_06045 [Piscibacillus sp. B03]|uniref:hypothetical protein n=1 Tax=Piscibacillus sp. B03 TaxID=3457430 RepID=UPI003FCED900